MLVATILDSANREHFCYRRILDSTGLEDEAGLLVGSPPCGEGYSWRRPGPDPSCPDIKVELPEDVRKSSQRG